MKYILIVYILIFLCSCSKEKMFVYLIPKGYQGPLVIIEDAQSKDFIQLKNDTIVFDFRKSVILRFKGKFIEGGYSLSSLKYYYVDSIGDKTEIPIGLGSYTSQDSNKIYLHLKHTQIRANSKCDLVSSPKDFTVNLRLQQYLCDSLFAVRP